jgi:hypothetical protein
MGLHLNFKKVKLLPCFDQFYFLMTKVNLQVEGLLHSYHQFCAMVVGVELLHFLRLFQYFEGIPAAFWGGGGG